MVVVVDRDSVGILPMWNIESVLSVFTVCKDFALHDSDNDYKKKCDNIGVISKYVEVAYVYTESPHGRNLQCAQIFKDNKQSVNFTQKGRCTVHLSVSCLTSSMRKFMSLPS